MDCKEWPEEMWCKTHKHHWSICQGKEIDRLRAEVERLRQVPNIDYLNKLEAENAALRKESCEWSYMRANCENLRMENTVLKAKADSAGELVLKMDLRLLKVEEENAKLREAIKAGGHNHSEQYEEDWFWDDCALCLMQKLDGKVWPEEPRRT